jgi:putrescine transport system substrate-binding protein
MTFPRLLAALLAASGIASAMAAEDPVVHVYNWSDYITDAAITGFQTKTGIKVVYDVYDANEVLEAKLLAGKSGYDLVFPTDRPFAQRHIQAGLYRKLDKTKLKGWNNLDPAILASLAEVDPGNQYLVPYMWGATGVGYNVNEVEKALGDAFQPDTWRLVFDPAVASKLADCGISLLDDPVEVLAAALIYLGRDPNGAEQADMDALMALFKAIRPYIRYFHSSQYINDLANGDICVALGYSGDVFQARDRAAEAGNGVEIVFAIPREGAVIATDVMAIPVDAPHPAAAHAFIDYLLEPGVIAEITNYVAFANANRASLPLLDESVREDPGIYPPEAVRAHLMSPKELDPKAQRLRTRTWTRIKTGR